MSDTLLQDTALALQADWQLQLPETLSEEVLLQLLADRIVDIIQKGPEAFFQLMYRLDVSEKKLTAALHDADIAQQVARLVYNRQLQKVKSRQEHRSAVIDDDPELQW